MAVEPFSPQALPCGDIGSRGVQRNTALRSSPACEGPCPGMSWLISWPPSPWQQWSCPWTCERWSWCAPLCPAGLQSQGHVQALPVSSGLHVILLDVHGLCTNCMDSARPAQHQELYSGSLRSKLRLRHCRTRALEAAMPWAQCSAVSGILCGCTSPRGGQQDSASQVSTLLSTRAGSSPTSSMNTTRRHLLTTTMRQHFTGETTRP